MEGKLNFLSRVKISIFKVRSYSIFLDEGLNKSMTYMLMLSVIIGMISGVIQFNVLTGLEKSAKNLLKQEDFKFEMSSGILDFKSSPYKQEENSDIIIIDTNKLLSDSESIRYVIVHKDRSVVFFKDGILANINDEEYRFKYSDIPYNEYINNDVALNALNNSKPIKYIWVVATILITYIVSMFNAVFISLLGLISNKTSGLNLNYKDVLKLSIYSTTLTIIIKTIIPIGSFSIIISSIYLVIAINIINSQKIKINQ